MRHIPRFTLVLLLAVCTPMFVAADDAKPALPVAGTWEGTLKAIIDVTLVFRVTAKPDGTLSATGSTAEEGAKEVPFDSAEFKDGKLTITLKRANITYTGTLSKDGKTITGQFKEKGVPLPLDLTRVDKVHVQKRPQTPAKPYPYREEDVTFDNPAAKGVKLAGTLTLPKGDGPFAAVMLLTGSGPSDRDETVLGHKPFLVIADHLTRNGVAVLRCDDRGVGKSKGNYSKATTADFATDAEAGVAFLKGRRDIDPKKIGLIGHSEGALIAALAASRSDDVAFIVLLAGNALPGDETMMIQARLIAQAEGATPATLAGDARFQRHALELAKAGADAAHLEAALREELARLPAEERKAVEEKGRLGAAVAGIKALAGPWLTFFVSYDPRPALRRVKCPVLALNGSKDLQVPPKEHLPEVAKALREGGNRDVTVKELPGLNHLFQKCETGKLAEYGRIEETFNPEVLKLITEWVKERTK
jgi:uncharacterized protein